MNSKLKWYTVKIVRRILNMFSVIKIIPNRIFITCYTGEKYTCNPKYVCEYLQTVFPGKFEIIWEYRKRKPDFKTEIKLVRRDTLVYYLYLFSSKVVISNAGFRKFIPKRKGQILLETWHGGGAYKKLNNDDKSDEYKEKLRLLVNSDIDIHLSSCRKFMLDFGEECYIPPKVFLTSGLPRNDLFFNDFNLIKEKVKKKYGVGENTIVVLYAPTWRDDGRQIQADIFNTKFMNIIEDKFKKKVIFWYRGHYFKNDCLIKNVIDVSEHDDMQELLCAADILITDYSSCMWDFSLMFKPCFIYANDLNKYKQERDFYTPIEEWPFPIAQDSEVLRQNVLNFDYEKYLKRVKEHHKSLGTYETGNACEITCKKIHEICYGGQQ